MRISLADGVNGVSCGCGLGLPVDDDGQCLACWSALASFGGARTCRWFPEPVIAGETFEGFDLATQDLLTSRQQTGMAGR